MVRNTKIKGCIAVLYDYLELFDRFWYLIDDETTRHQFFVMCKMVLELTECDEYVVLLKTKWGVELPDKIEFNRDGKCIFSITYEEDD